MILWKASAEDGDRDGLSVEEMKEMASAEEMKRWSAEEEERWNGCLALRIL